MKTLRAVLVLCALAAAPAARAQQPPDSDFECLRNLRSLYVTIDVGTLDGRDTELRKEIGALLARHHVPLATREQWLHDSEVGHAVIVISGDANATTLSLNILQELWQVRGGKPVSSFVVNTFQRSETVASGSADSTATITRLLAEFGGAWRSTHPLASASRQG